MVGSAGEVVTGEVVVVVVVLDGVVQASGAGPSSVTPSAHVAVHDTSSPVQVKPGSEVRATTS